MAGISVGNIGAYKVAYDRWRKEEAIGESVTNMDDESVWVNKRYIPTDLRHTAPVPRYKLLSMNPKGLANSQRHWMSLMDAPLSSFSRETGQVFASHPSSRCEEWSTLRQMLPSQGSPVVAHPPNWGTGVSLPPIMSSRPINRIPKMNSPMTRYVDDMHSTNRLFKLH